MPTPCATASYGSLPVDDHHSEVAVRLVPPVGALFTSATIDKTISIGTGAVSRFDIVQFATSGGPTGVIEIGRIAFPAAETDSFTTDPVSILSSCILVELQIIYTSGTGTSVSTQTLDIFCSGVVDPSHSRYLLLRAKFGGAIPGRS